MMGTVPFCPRPAGEIRPKGGKGETRFALDFVHEAPPCGRFAATSPRKCGGEKSALHCDHGAAAEGAKRCEPMEGA